MDASADTAMPHPSGEAFAFDERRRRGEVTSIVCSRARWAYLAEDLHRDGHAGKDRNPEGNVVAGLDPLDSKGSRPAGRPASSGGWDRRPAASGRYG